MVQSTSVNTQAHDALEKKIREIANRLRGPYPDFANSGHWEMITH